MLYQNIYVYDTMASAAFLFHYKPYNRCLFVYSCQFTHPTLTVLFSLFTIVQRAAC